MMPKQKGDNIPAVKGKYEVGYGKPPKEHRIKPGQVLNPKGQRSAGAIITQLVNALAEQDLSVAELRKIARDPATPWTKRAAAERIIRTVEAGDLADME